MGKLIEAIRENDQGSVVKAFRKFVTVVTPRSSRVTKEQQKVQAVAFNVLLSILRPNERIRLVDFIIGNLNLRANMWREFLAGVLSLGDVNLTNRVMQLAQSQVFNRFNPHRTQWGKLLLDIRKVLDDHRVPTLDSKQLKVPDSIFRQPFLKPKTEIANFKVPINRKLESSRHLQRTNGRHLNLSHTPQNNLQDLVNVMLQTRSIRSEE